MTPAYLDVTLLHELVAPSLLFQHVTLYLLDLSLQLLQLGIRLAEDLMLAALPKQTELVIDIGHILF